MVLPLADLLTQSLDAAACSFHRLFDIGQVQVLIIVQIPSTGNACIQIPCSRGSRLVLRRALAVLVVMGLAKGEARRDPSTVSWLEARRLVSGRDNLTDVFVFQMVRMGHEERPASCP